MKFSVQPLVKPLRTALLPLMAALVLAGCATVPSGLPEIQTTAQFKEQGKEQQQQGATPPAGFTRAVPAEAQPRGAWWLAFNDPVLNSLVEKADVNNGNIQAAAARLAEARALARSANADRLPQIGLSAGANRGAGLDKATASTRPATMTNIGATFSYEVDLFGRLSGASNAAKLDAAGREALLQSTRLAVQAEVAQTYLQLRALDAERALVREQVEAYRDTLRLSQRREQAGDIAELDVARVQTEVSSTESDALALDRQRAQVEHALAVLVGDSASSFGLSGADWSTTLPSIPPGVPATVLTRRPDVSAAQSAVLAAQARVGVAQAAWFPDISLTGAAGYASPEIGDLFKWSARSWGVGALLSLPIFDGGRREAGVQGANAQLDGALASYRTQVLVAFQEVEDQLAAIRTLQEQSVVQAQAVTSAARATSLSDTRYRNGYISQLDLLDARRSELRNRRQALQVKSAQYQAAVGLIRAIGGGWDVPAPVAAAGTAQTTVAAR
ncbi:efflux transporter outer membrane subunit [Variovorax guangxiensis]|uniref:Efflux transporter outer membrane subunit n=1 Tax=Variovorax guangxiensis TaxID=1775474 RepID=A0A3S1A5D1_9BURK|nr:efflux transporter outer membrane subunit [Variovorax guangxiensis]RUR69873.1 efflux transporter outer membrane subunit [Variovorax guangxiensis]